MNSRIVIKKALNHSPKISPHRELSPLIKPKISSKSPKTQQKSPESEQKPISLYTPNPPFRNSSIKTNESNNNE
jgi:hypothetical protein